MTYLFARVIILLAISLLCDSSPYTCDKNRVPCGCGQATVGMNARIVNGENAVPNSWPMMVSLKSHQNFDEHFCGGTILTESYILTAAHCVDQFSNDVLSENLTITAGVHNLSQPNRIIRQVDQIIIHPSWEEYKHDAQYDIALLHLVEPLDLRESSILSRTCLPARLNTMEEMVKYPLNSTSLVVIGWGNLRTGGSSPDILQQVTVHSIHHLDRECSNTIRDPSIHFCAALYEGGKGKRYNFKVSANLMIT